MASSCRWFQFSLRGLLVVLTIGCLWLGWKADRAWKQCAAVEAIEAIGGVVVYDWQTSVDSWEVLPATSKFSRWGPSPAHRLVPDDAEPPAPAWLRKLLGEHFFKRPTSVIFRTRRASYSKQGKLLTIASLEPDSARTQEIEALVPHLHQLPALRSIYLQGEEKDIAQTVEDRLAREFPQCRIIRESVVTAVK